MMEWILQHIYLQFSVCWKFEREALARVVASRQCALGVIMTKAVCE